ncbi:hypothetical protein BGW36DRAFT_364616 [Talaromyces proteolyticus]|uniref:Clr5 domain-containing protein n=1 Tax=Talaromyces proteolyticus TaxID=1131652 RepID=A0AAD4PRV2_9EURO|nr:uncharacterized protein BGW36DRAFT_364616 [Talaromyces proteolyticus]KAH8689875.1 hypothetical protein BGW36DRAFT_364616 [Talaromyces proteolyticus]
MEFSRPKYPEQQFPKMEKSNNVQFQPPHADDFANQTVQNELNIINGFQVSAARNSASFPTYLQNIHGVPFDSQNSIPMTIANNSTTPVTIIPARTMSRQVISYPEDVWEMHRPRIRHLYIEKDKKLSEVMNQLDAEAEFKPSIHMYKNHLAAWGFYKRNREKDISVLLGLKNARDSAGKSSVIFRSGKPISMENIYRYLRRKKLDPQTFEQAREYEELAAIANHICIRTPSPVPQVSHLLFPPGNLRNKEMVLLNINQEYQALAREIAKPIEPRWPTTMSHLPGDHFLNIIDCISLLLQQGLGLFEIQMFVEGGTYVRAAFVFVEFLFKEMSKGERPGGKSLAWIFGLWILLRKTAMPDISGTLFKHMTKMAKTYLPKAHPALEILCNLYHVYEGDDYDGFMRFISSTWADSIHAITSVFNSTGRNAAPYLPHSLWMGESSGHLRQFQETVLEFWRPDTIKSWRQRMKKCSLVVCDNRQLYLPAPAHEGVLTLIWLRRFLIDDFMDPRGSNLPMLHSVHDTRMGNYVIKTAIATRLELSVGKENSLGTSTSIRVLSGDVYQVGHLHQIRPGEDISAFKDDYDLGISSFENLKTAFQSTSGLENENSTWFNWLRILEESLMEPGESQGIDSVVSCTCLRGKGLSFDYMRSENGELGIDKYKMDSGGPDKPFPSDGYMSFSGWGIIQN